MTMKGKIDQNHYRAESTKFVYTFEEDVLEVVVREGSDVAMCHKKTDGSYQQSFGGTLVMSCPASWSAKDAAIAHSIAKKAYRDGVAKGRADLGADIADMLGLATKIDLEDLDR